MTNPTIETLSQTEVMRRDEMKEPDDVSAMLRPKSLGWGARRIAAGARVFANDGPALAKRGCVAPAGTATAITC
jgi:hypothetical protein